MRVIIAALLSSVLCAPVARTQPTSLSDAQIKEQIVKDSRAGYHAKRGDHNLIRSTSFCVSRSSVRS